MRDDWVGIIFVTLLKGDDGARGGGLGGHTNGLVGEKHVKKKKACKKIHGGDVHNTCKNTYKDRGRIDAEAIASPIFWSSLEHFRRLIPGLAFNFKK
ncbi:hypothetical protein CEXT_422471 [Caerostris extrusa]|uniref:Secreted protein n=1 Tax=Caerostris extrusa TaxID=172846 RepID=A0AAV4NGR3_CAEEX|nr:hypothetical protein CEXT_422471 [Caerostris extrusa]